MSDRREIRFAVFIGLLVLILVTIPYVYASISAGEDFVFGGFLANPLDGNSYLAKMYQGWEGDWRFQLPFTAEPGEGAYLNMFYLLLGHIARILHFPLLGVFHFARLLGAVVLLWALWRFFYAIFSEPRPRKLAFALAALGSGMGWLLIPFGAFTADFWVAETYPFLSVYTNPHFPLGLALVLGLVVPGKLEEWGVRRALLIALGALTLSIISPFGVVVTLVILGGRQLACGEWRGANDELANRRVGESANKRSSIIGRRSSVIGRRSSVLGQQLIIVLIFGIPILLYDLWVAYTDPAFAAWNAQNLTPSPPLWDVIISLSPALPLALFGAWAMFIRRQSPIDNRQTPPGLLLLLWAVSGLVLLYLPFSLQRRFMMGLFVPVAGLAAWGLEYLAGNRQRRYRVLTTALFTLALLTNVVILLAALHGVQTHDMQIYLTRGETQALTWIADNTQPDALILTGPATGLFIPAHTGRRVIYGHPFETVNAEAEEAAVTQFFAGDLTAEQAQAFITDRGVNYIFLGPREHALGQAALPAALHPVYTANEVTVFQVKTAP